MLTVISNANLAAGAKYFVTDNGDRNHSVDASSTGTWSVTKKLADFGNFQTHAYETITRFTLTEPCEDVTLIVDGVTDNAGSIVGV